MMTKATRLSFALFIIAAFALGSGCKGEESAAPEVDEEAEAEAADEGEADEEVASEDEATDDEGDYIRVLAKHAPEKEDDPVVVEFRSFEVTSASFDPENLEGGEATLEVNLESLQTDNEKRDEHLRSADYLDTGDGLVATVNVSDVEQVEGDRYKANAAVTIGDAEVTWPVELEVVEREGDTIRVRSSYSFDRMELNVGQEEVGEDADPVARDMVLEAQLTVSPS